MRFTTEGIIDSLGRVLTARYPDYPVYSSSTQQGTDFPCFFIFFMPSTIESEIDDRFFRDLGIDLVFVQQRHIVNGNAEILSIAEYLDEMLELFSYSDGECEPVLLRTYERQWQTEDGELHYKFHIRQRVAVPRDDVLMEEMEENNAGIKDITTKEISD